MKTASSQAGRGHGAPPKIHHHRANPASLTSGYTGRNVLDIRDDFGDWRTDCLDAPHALPSGGSWNDYYTTSVPGWEHGSSEIDGVGRVGVFA